MDLKQIAKQIKIDATQLIREKWEMRILKNLFDSALGKKVYFKGGTTLRLAYNSPRFSEDLDFLMVKPVAFGAFQKFANDVIKTFPEVKINDIYSKYFTLIAQFTISDPEMPVNFSVKVEISKRAKKYPYSLKLLISPATNIQVLANVEDLAGIYQEKLEAIRTRAKPRDLFDLWFISQKLRETLPKNLPRIPRSQIRSELNKFLPMDFLPVARELEEKYGK